MKQVLYTLLFLFANNLSFPQSRMTPESAAADILNNLNNKDFKKVSVLFDENIAAKLNDVKLGQVYASLLEKFGSLKNSSVLPSTRELDGSIIVDQLCGFENMSLICRIKFNDLNKISALQFVPPGQKVSYKTPDYAKPDSIIEREIEIISGEYKLPGILTLPKKGNKFPVVILVHGSGPNSKDESIGPNKIFKDLAYGLSSLGIAVIRYDKRTLVYGAQMMELQDKLTVKEETTDDAKAAIQFAKTIKEIDSEKIFVCGHSLGGMLAPKIAEESPEIAGAIIMAGNARPLPELIIDQTNYLLHLDEFTADDEKKLGEVKKQCVLAMNKNLTLQTSTEILPLQTPAAYWKYLQNYNQILVASKIETPLLILQGQRDYQVTLKEFEIWKETLVNKKNTSFHLYEKLNHLFIEGPGKISTPKEYEEQGNVAHYVINDIAAFVLENKK